MEYWKEIPEYENKYQISNKGNIKSLDRFEKSPVDQVCIIQKKY